MKSSSVYLLLLLLIANPAFSAANTNGDEPNVCPKTRVITQTNSTVQDNDTVSSAPVATSRPTPVRATTRATTPRTVSPRWHSMLPGMFR